MLLPLPFLLRAYFLLTSCSVLLAYVTPSLRASFIPYGKTLTSSAKNKSGTGSQAREQKKDSLLDWAASWTVPKKFFKHFYVLSTFVSIGWAWVIIERRWRDAPISPWLSTWRTQSSLEVALTWAMMLIQGVRRLCECFFVERPTQARMWIGHYVVGLGFYSAMSLAVWIEGASNVLDPNSSFQISQLVTPKTMLAVALFIGASVRQCTLHAHLASLRPPTSAASKPEYKLPTHPAFLRTVAPHYTAEIGIYAAMVLANSGSNLTLWCALVWVAVNLSVSATSSREWMIERFGERGRIRWVIMAGVY
ncbi:hypothetical protein SAICODRAFT_96256 [Saitoella complicata NRRL Y-17804]|nr:uncharacterized protein SAICODRAFT_96256 [Saitoella complicata NRRL Y-17804]ODQ50796.1 hypothetical protein SAICODRAFT_96256 [Saitoella complicata NRRL Y-17804]